MLTDPPKEKVADYSRLIPRDKRFDVNLWVRAKQTTTGGASGKITNISRGGCRMECMFTFDPAQILLIKLDHGIKLRAYIRWSNATRYGCQFEKPLSDRELTDLLEA